MAEKTKKEKAIDAVKKLTSPLAATAFELKKLRDKKKKAKFQEGDYSDIDIKGIIDPKEIEVKSVDMPKYKNPDDKSVKMPTRKETGKFKSVEMPTRKEKKTITVPSNSKNIPKFKSGGRAGYKGGKSVKKKGGCAIKGTSPILR